ncbi:MAG: type II toxin-antitoxin system HicA family toxin [Bombilactobacillus sp.]
MYNPKTKVTTFVPIHSKELKPGLEQAILKEAGLK